MKGVLIGLLLSISIVGFAQEKNFIDQNYMVLRLFVWIDEKSNAFVV